MTTIFWIQCWKGISCKPPALPFLDTAEWMDTSERKRMTTGLSLQQRARGLWTDEPMGGRKRCACRTWRGRTCAGLLLCDITVQCFYHALDVPTGGREHVCVCVCRSAIYRETEWWCHCLCECVYVYIYTHTFIYTYIYIHTKILYNLFLINDIHKHKYIWVYGWVRGRKR